jgi:hypothetical protein
VVISSNQIQKSYVSDLTDNLPKLEKKASEAIKSFAALVDELNKVSQLSSGTPVNKQVKELSANMNNTQANRIFDPSGRIFRRPCLIRRENWRATIKNDMTARL